MISCVVLFVTLMNARIAGVGLEHVAARLQRYVVSPPSTVTSTLPAAHPAMDVTGMG
ncbi:MAG TPA: hypothetical protein VMS98_09840 [Thermoanaerobaculia bacterium]|nr:hypothetical protein [Thermoanaerobaculia bacterium]